MEDPELPHREADVRAVTLVKHPKRAEAVERIVPAFTIGLTILIVGGAIASGLRDPLGMILALTLLLAVTSTAMLAASRMTDSPRFELGDNWLIPTSYDNRGDAGKPIRLTDATLSIWVEDESRRGRALGAFTWYVTGADGVGGAVEGRKLWKAIRDPERYAHLRAKLLALAEPAGDHEDTQGTHEPP